MITVVTLLAGAFVSYALKTATDPLESRIIRLEEELKLSSEVNQLKQDLSALRQQLEEIQPESE